MRTAPGETGNILIKTAVAVAGTALIAEVLSSCTSSGFVDKSPDYSKWDKGPNAFVSHMIGQNLVDVCIGQVGLRADGHVRRTPIAYSDNDNVLKGFSNNQGQFVIKDPERLHMSNGDGVSHTWYITRTLNSQFAFVNYNALIRHDTLKCTQPATPTSVPGTITAR